MNKTLLLVTLCIFSCAALAIDTTFSYLPLPDEVVSSISLRGDFNDWAETAFLLQDDGTWSLTLDLSAGEYAYKYFINGQWPADMATARAGGPVDAAADRYRDDGHGGQNAIRMIEGVLLNQAALESASERPDGYARIHYHRPDGDYEGWGLHLWLDSSEEVTWTSAKEPTGQDSYGLYWDVALLEAAEQVGFIVHQGDNKDPGPDMFLVIAEHGQEIWLLSGSAEIFTQAPDVGELPRGDISRARAHWVDERTIAWKTTAGLEAHYQLYYSPRATLRLDRDGILGGQAITLTADPDGLSGPTRRKFPHLQGFAALTISDADAALIPEIVQGQLALAAYDDRGLIDATSVQIPGVLDDLFAYDGALGVVWQADRPSLRLWAPTAQQVRLHLYTDSYSSEASVLDMVADNGLWQIEGDASWSWQYYLYEVTVYTPSTGQIEVNLVTDPYSRSLSSNSRRSQIVNLDDPALKPAGWDALSKPPLEAPEDIVLYELHIRDFSALDSSVSPEYRGGYLAFTGDGLGVQHLKSLAEAGLSHVHLLPSFDLATINENAAERQEPDIAMFAPDSLRPQAILAAIRDEDAYNWGYDPYHFGVPEGSYSTDPEGEGRILEYRQMVKALSAMGLRLVLDVVYNHTNASGQAEKSVLDRIVPGYYHRLNADGFVETSTCCQNTATEHAMMRKLMVDDLVHWAKTYKVDGFRFDLMGHHMRADMLAAQQALQTLTLAEDGVDGTKIYLYGEGWDFGEVASNARGINATQENMAGTGIGTFNDRIRDAARGGSPFSDRREQGFISGLYDQPNGFNQGGEADLMQLYQHMDRIRASLAGNLRDYSFTSYTGEVITGGQIAYGAYTQDPQENISYVSAHDNETLFDKLVYAVPEAETAGDILRRQNLGLSLAMFSQGLPFFHAGSEMLRSKSMDADSYNSGDHFNRLDFSYQSNNFGVGLPPAEKNRDNWALIGSHLSDLSMQPSPDDIRANVSYFQELLAIRDSSSLFRLQTAEDVQARVRFYNTGVGQVPGLIVMSISDDLAGMADLDPQHEQIVVVFNATQRVLDFEVESLKGLDLRLHPLQGQSADVTVRLSRFDASKGHLRVPALTTAVFVAAE